MAGRRSKPTVLKRLDGNPGKRALYDAEMQPKPGIPDPPDILQLEALALEEWERIAPELAAMGALTHLDSTALAAYCVSYARWRQCEELLATQGMLLPDGRKTRYARSGRKRCSRCACGLSSSG